MSKEPRRKVVNAHSPITDMDMLKPELKRKAEYIIKTLKAEGFNPFVVETKRTMARVLWLISTGAFASKTSKHLSGSAIDIAFTDEHGKAIWDAEYKGYRRMAQLAAEQHLIAGYNWKAKDAVHIELP